MLFYYQRNNGLQLYKPNKKKPHLKRHYKVALSLLTAAALLQSISVHAQAVDYCDLGQATISEFNAPNACLKNYLDAAGKPIGIVKDEQTDASYSAQNTNCVQDTIQLLQFEQRQTTNLPTIRTLLLVSDWRSTEDTTSSNLATLSYAFTNSGAPSVGQTATWQTGITWTDTTSPSQLIDVQNPATYQNLFIKYQCSQPWCKPITIHVVACYEEDVVVDISDQPNVYQMTYYDDPINIKCASSVDPTTCNGLSELRLNKDWYVKFQSIGASSLNIIPGVSATQGPEELYAQTVEVFSIDHIGTGSDTKVSAFTEELIASAVVSPYDARRVTSMAISQMIVTFKIVATLPANGLEFKHAHYFLLQEHGVCSAVDSCFSKHCAVIRGELDNINPTETNKIREWDVTLHPDCFSNDVSVETTPGNGVTTDLTVEKLKVNQSKKWELTFKDPVTAPFTFGAGVRMSDGTSGSIITSKFRQVIDPTTCPQATIYSPNQIELTLQPGEFSEKSIVLNDYVFDAVDSSQNYSNSEFCIAYRTYEFTATDCQPFRDCLIDSEGRFHVIPFESKFLINNPLSISLPISTSIYGTLKSNNNVQVTVESLIVSETVQPIPQLTYIITQTAMTIDMNDLWTIAEPSDQVAYYNVLDKSFALDVQAITPNESQIKGFFSIDTETGQIITIETQNLFERGSYTFTVTMTIENSLNSDNGNILSRALIVEIKGFCDYSVLSPTIDTVNMYGIIGNPSRSFTFLDYKDTVSIERDAVDSDSLGYGYCGAREHFLYEENTQIGGQKVQVGPETSYNFLDIVQDYNELTVTYGSSQSQFAGNHEVQLDVRLQNYNDTVYDQSAKLNITLYEQLNDLSMNDFEYQLNSGNAVIAVPKIEMKPALHESLDEQTRENGAQILYHIFIASGGGEYEPIKEDLATFDSIASEITLNSQDISQIGVHTIRIDFQFQDYLRNESLSTEFNLQILPELIQDDFIISAKPQFDWEGREMTYDLMYGEPFNFKLPTGWHQDNIPVFYNKVDKGKTSSFLDADLEQQTITILPNVTTQDQIGAYSVKFQLIDEAGVLSEWATLTINILGETTQESEVIDNDESSEEKSEEIGTTSKDEPILQKVTNSPLLGQKFAALLKERYSKAQSQMIGEEERILVPPTAKIMFADSKGLVKIAFSNKMLISQELKNMDQNGRVKVNFDSQRNLQTEATFDVLSVKVIAGEETLSDNLDFSWYLDYINESGMAVQLEFKQPLYVSSEQDKDQVEIKFTNENFFVDEDQQSLNDGFMLRKQLPVQYADASTAEDIENSGAAMGSSTQTLILLNFAANILLGSSQQYLWEMVNAQQIVVLLPLFNVIIPMSCMLVFDKLMAIASFEALPTDMIYGWFSEVEGEPKNDQFEKVGFEHHLLLNNFGTLGFIIACLPMLYLIYAILSYCHGIKRIKRVHNRLSRSLFWGFPFRMLIESYILCLICVFLNLERLEFASEDKWVQANSYIAVFLATVYILFPIGAICFMYTNFRELEENHVKKKMGTLYQGYNTKTRTMLIWWGAEFARKVLLATCVVFFQTHLWLQMFAVFFNSTLLVIIAGHIKSRRTKFDSRMDMFNEVKLIIIMYNLMLFSLLVQDPLLKYKIGYSCATCVTLGLAINLSIIFVEPVRQAKRSCRIRIAKKQMKKRIKIDKPRFEASRFQERKEKAFEKWIMEQYEVFRRQEEQQKQDEELARALNEREDESGYDSNYPSSVSSCSSSFERPEDGDDRILKNRRPLITEKIKLQSNGDDSKLIVAESEISLTNSAAEITNMGYNSRTDANILLNITEEPAPGAIAIKDTKICNKRNCEKIQNKERELMTEDELQWLSQQMGISADFLTQFPGFENFEVVPNDHKAFSRPKQLNKDAEKSQKITGLKVSDSKQGYSVEEEQYYFGQSEEIKMSKTPLLTIDVSKFKGKTNKVLPKVQSADFKDQQHQNIKLESNRKSEKSKSKQRHDQIRNQTSLQVQKQLRSINHLDPHLYRIEEEEAPIAQEEYERMKKDSQMMGQKKFD